MADFAFSLHDWLNILFLLPYDLNFIKYPCFGF